MYIYMCSTAEFDKKCFVQIKLKLKEIVCYFIAIRYNCSSVFYESFGHVLSTRIFVDMTRLFFPY